MDLGVRAYVASDGKTAVAAILNDFVNDRDVSSATDSVFGTDPKKDYFSFSRLLDLRARHRGHHPDRRDDGRLRRLRDDRLNSRASG
jgi:hypothetical protein